jgi:phosphoglycerate-specific signal transduction histidine kinase
VGLLGVAFLLVFVAVVMLTYRNWQREDAERLDKELERVREQLSTECRRLAGEVQREKVVRLTAHADQIKRQVQMQIDDLQRDRQQREQAQLAELRDRSRRRKEQLDRQLREAQGHAARLGKLLQEAQRLHDDAVHDARDVAAKRGLLA